LKLSRIFWGSEGRALTVDHRFSEAIRLYVGQVLVVTMLLAFLSFLPVLILVSLSALGLALMLGKTVLAAIVVFTILCFWIGYRKVRRLMDL